jgi:glutamate--cysteine ligase
MDHRIGALGAASPQTRFASGDASQTHAISRYITRGAEHDCGNRVGVELEHFIVRKADKALVPYRYDPITGAPGVGAILERLAPFYRERVHETHPDGSRDLIGLNRNCSNITLEPGAQIEISISPALEIRDIETVYHAFRAELDPILDEFGYELLTLGYHPTSCARDIPLIPKGRYHFMDEHFKTTGAHGICMMRATASTQVSIDYSSEEDAVRKFRIANLLSPLFAFITDNSPIFEGMPVGGSLVGDRSDGVDSAGTPVGTAPVGGISASGLPLPERMARTVIWDDVDAARSMTAPGTFDADFRFDSYASAILQAPAIFTMEKDETGKDRGVNQNGRSFAEVFDGVELRREDIEHILSLFFFDVRFKTYVEIRVADSLPLPYALAFTAFIKGIFYNKEALAALDATVIRLGRDGNASVAHAKAALRQQGYRALVYGREAGEWLDELARMAWSSLGEDDRRYLVPLVELIASRTTLADAALATALAKPRVANADAPDTDPLDDILSGMAYGGELVLEATSALAELIGGVISEA